MNRLGFAKIFVHNLDAMAAFCGKVLGARELARLTIDGMDEILMTFSGREPELVLMRRHADVPLDQGSMYGPVGLIVEDCAATLAACEAGGGAVTMAPVDMDGGALRIAFATTPEGHELELVEQRHKQGN